MGYNTGKNEDKAELKVEAYNYSKERYYVMLTKYEEKEGNISDSIIQRNQSSKKIFIL